MPITNFQSEVLRTLAAQRSPDSYIAGGIAINREGPRFSGDIDIFHDSESRLDSAVKADIAALTAAGYGVTLERVREGKQDATVVRQADTMKLEWVTDAAFRFFPTQPDDLFGYVLHPVDLATNKASAAADRRVPRDISAAVLGEADMTYSEDSGRVFWITGLSGSGKSTVAGALHAKLRSMGLSTVMVDGDAVRDLLLTNSRMDRESRLKIAEFNARFCRFLCLQGLNVVCATISLFHSIQVWNRAEIPNYVEIFLNTPLGVIEKRDPKGLYARARAGTLTDVVGIDIPPEWPLAPDFRFSAEGPAASRRTAELIEKVIAKEFANR